MKLICEWCQLTNGQKHKINKISPHNLLTSSASVAVVPLSILLVVVPVDANEFAKNEQLKVEVAEPQTPCPWTLNERAAAAFRAQDDLRPST